MTKTHGISFDPSDQPTITHIAQLYNPAGKEVACIIDEIPEHYKIFEKWGNNPIDSYTQNFIYDGKLGAYVDLHDEGKDTIQYTISLPGRTARAVTDIGGMVILDKNKMLRFAFQFTTAKELTAMILLKELTDKLKPK